MKTSVKLESDIKRSNVSNDLKKDLITQISKNNTEFKKIIKQVKSISEELSMLHERINTENIRHKVFKLNTLEEQKKYVDSLYAKYDSQNKVKQTYMANYNILKIVFIGMYRFSMEVILKKILIYLLVVVRVNLLA